MPSPSGTFVMRKFPPVSVVATNWPPLSAVTDTVAPEIPPPRLFDTTPRMDPALVAGFVAVKQLDPADTATAISTAHTRSAYARCGECH